jgi:hypothetical protein
MLHYQGSPQVILHTHMVGPTSSKLSIRPFQISPSTSPPPFFSLKKSRVGSLGRGCVFQVSFGEAAHGERRRRCVRLPRRGNPLGAQTRLLRQATGGAVSGELAWLVTRPCGATRACGRHVAPRLAAELRSLDWRHGPVEDLSVGAC